MKPGARPQGGDRGKGTTAPAHAGGRGGCPVVTRPLGSADRLEAPRNSQELPRGGSATGPNSGPARPARSIDRPLGAGLVATGRSGSRPIARRTLPGARCGLTLSHNASVRSDLVDGQPVANGIQPAQPRPRP